MLQKHATSQICIEDVVFCQSHERHDMTSTPEGSKQPTEEQQRLIDIASSVAAELDDTKFAYAAKVIRDLNAEILSLVAGPQDIQKEPEPEVAKKSSRRLLTSPPERVSTLSHGRKIEDISDDEMEPQKPTPLYVIGQTVNLNEGDDLEPYLSECTVDSVRWNDKKQSYVYLIERIGSQGDLITIKENAIYR